MPKKICDVYDPLLPTLLISIHKIYVKQILSGKKVIEYRKKFFNDPFQAFVYTTGKNGGIEMFIKCDAPIIDNAHKLATIGETIQHDNYGDIFDYFKKKNTGYIIPIIEVYQFKKVDLQYLRTELPSFVVPQKYLFLDRQDKQNLLNLLLQQVCSNKLINNWDFYFKQAKKCIDSINDN